MWKVSITEINIAYFIAWYTEFQWCVCNVIKYPSTADEEV